MNIALVRHSIRNRGADRSHFYFCNYLIRQGHSINYYTNEQKTSLPFNTKINFSEIPYPSIVGTIIFMAFHKFDEDIVIVDLALMAFLGTFRNHKKLLYSARDYDVSYYSSPLLKALTKFCYRYALGQKKIPTISASENLTKQLKEYDPGTITTVSNGVDLKLFYRNPHSEFLRTKGTHRIVLLFARHDHRKGLDVAIKALTALSQKNDIHPWQLWLVGDPVSELPPRLMTHHFGYLTGEKLRDVLSAVDIYFMASRSEGLSTLLLQAMACGCAIVGTEAVNINLHGLTGLIAPIEDWGKLAEHLAELLNNEQETNKFSSRSIELSKQYSIETTCQNYEHALIQSLKS